MVYSVAQRQATLVRCLRKDVATDSLMEAWVTIYWGIHGHPTGTPPCTPMGLWGQRGQNLKVCKSDQTCLVLCL